MCYNFIGLMIAGSFIQNALHYLIKLIFNSCHISIISTLILSGDFIEHMMLYFRLSFLPSFAEFGENFKRDFISMRILLKYDKHEKLIQFSDQITTTKT